MLRHATEQPARLYLLLGAIFTIIGLVSLALLLRFTSSANVVEQTAEVANAAPTMEDLIPSDVSGSGDISLPDPGLVPNEDTTVNLYVRGTVSDINGLTNLDHVTVNVYRSGVSGGADCLPDNNDCYVATVEKNQLAAVDGNDALATFEVAIPIQYYADPTDVGSPYEDETWQAKATVIDLSGGGGSMTKNFEIQSLAAFNLLKDGQPAASIYYGELALDSFSEQEELIFRNTGNRKEDSYIHAITDFKPELSDYSDILSTVVHFSLDDQFSYGTNDDSIKLTDSLLSLDLAQQTNDNTPTTRPAYFRLKMPASGIKGAYSNAVIFTAHAQPCLKDTPTLFASSVTSTMAGSGDLAVQLTGANFPVNAQAYFDATLLTSIRNSSTSLNATIPSNLLQTSDMHQITIKNPATAGVSNAIKFVVENPTPTLSAISPTSKNVGDTQFTLTLTGTGFISTSKVMLDAANERATTYISPTRLTAIILASDLHTAGQTGVTVLNPQPGGSATWSNQKILTANNPTPALTSVSPNYKTVGDTGSTLTLTGAGFTPESQVQLGGSNVTSTFISTTQMTFDVSTDYLASASTANITVTNPTPGGGTSGAVAFTVKNPVPTLSSISPDAKSVGDADFTLTLDGTNFVPTSKAQFNGANLVTTYVSPTQLTATVHSSDLSPANNYNVTVYNPAPGGGTSEARVLAVQNGIPTITSISPTSAVVGSSGVGVTISGSGYAGNAEVRLDGVGVTTIHYSSTTIIGSIPASSLTSSGTHDITIFNPAPGGGTSEAATFTVVNPVPVISSISPAYKVVNSAAFTMTINGSNFVNTSVVKVGGSARTTTFVSATQLTAYIPISDMWSAGNRAVTVTNPAPGGGTSGGQIFHVTTLAWSETQPAGANNIGWYTSDISPNGQYMILGVENGNIYTSADGGTSWTMRQPAGASTYQWRCVATSDDGTHLVAAAYNGRFYTSSDSGSTWTERQPAGDLNKWWIDVASSDDGSHLIAAVIAGRLYSSTDYGVSWSEFQPVGNVNTMWFAVDTDSDGSNLIASVNGGNVWTSSDYGATWTARLTGVAAQGVASDSDGSNLAVSVNGGDVWTSSNYGASWSQRTPGDVSNRAWRFIASDGTGANLMAGIYPTGKLYISQNSGVTWVEVNPAGLATGNWYTGGIDSSGLKFLVGSYGARVYIGK